MSEMRWNPILGEWVLTATHRQNRTFLPPAGYCPLCPTAAGGFPTEIPEENYEFVVFENKFPSFSPAPSSPDVVSSDFYPVEPSLGVCEVVLYSSDHTGSLAQMSEEKIGQLIRVWKDRYEELAAREEIEYVFIFENKGEAVGVTIHHPHGQIYAFPFIPPKVMRKIENEDKHAEKTGRCLHCDVIAEEKADGRRIVCENERFVAFIPFYARYPYEIHIYSQLHKDSMKAFDEADCDQLAQLLRVVLQKYDNLWNMSFPYMMVLYQKPTGSGNYTGAHFHIEFYPPLRTAQKLKYLAGVESGAGTFINDTLPEEKAMELRAIAPV